MTLLCWTHFALQLLPYLSPLTVKLVPIASLCVLCPVGGASAPAPHTVFICIQTPCPSSSGPSPLLTLLHTHSFLRVLQTLLLPGLTLQDTQVSRA